MVRTIQQIEREIETLDAAMGAIAQDFQAAYETYLAQLGGAVRKQLVLAVYHLCTQGYPEQFLHLNVNQRQQLQEELRGLTRQAQKDLMALLDPESQASRKATLPLNERVSEEQETVEDQALLEALQLNDMAFDEEVVIVHLAEGHTEAEAIASPPNDQPDDQPDQPDESFPSTDDTESAEKSLSPLAQLLEWRELIETGILEILQNLSHAANHLLYQASILPQKLPEQLLEVATKAAVASEMTNSSPNLLNLMVEAKGDENEVEITRILAIRLRLSELEFGDMMLSTGRSKLRGLSSRLNQLERDYQKRQREWAIAQAELAWRSIWFDE